ncbi:hypothetical protein V2G26_006710 [Clonostachys chloroleuca]
MRATSGAIVFYLHPPPLPLLALPMDATQPSPALVQNALLVAQAGLQQPCPVQRRCSSSSGGTSRGRSWLAESDRHKRHERRHLTSPELSTSGLSAFRFFLCSSPPALFFFFSLPLVSGQGLGRNAHHPLRTLFYFVLLSPPTYPGPPLSQLASAAASLNLPSSSWAAYASSTGS